MESDLIRRGYMLATLRLSGIDTKGKDSTLIEASEFVRVLKEAPAVDAEPVRHGRWKYLPPTPTLNGSYTCTACGSISFDPNINRAKYCPFCGAKMDAEEVTHEHGV